MTPTPPIGITFTNATFGNANFGGAPVSIPAWITMRLTMLWPAESVMAYARLAEGSSVGHTLGEQTLDAGLAAFMAAKT